jgi:amino acid permease
MSIAGNRNDDEQVGHNDSASSSSAAVTVTVDKNENDTSDNSDNHDGSKKGNTNITNTGTPLMGTIKTVFTVFKANTGSGFLFLPGACRDGGYLVYLVFIIFFGSVCVLGSLTLLESREMFVRIVKKRKSERVAETQSHSERQREQFEDQQEQPQETESEGPGTDKKSTAAPNRNSNSESLSGISTIAYGDLFGGILATYMCGKQRESSTSKSEDYNPLYLHYQRVGKYFVNVSIVLLQFGICIGYFISVSEMLPKTGILSPIIGILADSEIIERTDIINGDHNGSVISHSGSSRSRLSSDANANGGGGNTGNFNSSASSSENMQTLTTLLLLFIVIPFSWVRKVSKLAITNTIAQCLLFCGVVVIFGIEFEQQRRWQMERSEWQAANIQWEAESQSRNQFDDTMSTELSSASDGLNNSLNNLNLIERVGRMPMPTPPAPVILQVLGAVPEPESPHPATHISSRVPVPHLAKSPYPAPVKILPITSFSGILISIGTICFMFEGISSLLPIQNAMARPKTFPKIYTRCFVGIIILFFCVGFQGYRSYGVGTQDIILMNFGDSSSGGSNSSGNHNSPKTDADLIPLINLIRLAFSIAIIFSFPFQLLPGVRILEGPFFEPDVERSGPASRDGQYRLKFLWDVVGKSVYRSVWVREIGRV